ncbi:hypothetical protein FPQ18DRAFT_346918 [Pyronema domesticum]|uniref:Similar to Uncharacterized protein AN1985 acc. no. P0C0V6 n=1 Tax=Pyronema omphalodes (strain CBS 100304) TaxID=1076935 RepID=U4LV25_PYROM|nr:hypothetical protein FPQ18DRAFT_346918 [Pyronema domesticum]CCX32156.1 Similar to Uncharacterized protein AN1985; acc. no. P0C0V6 [Pyronema omphalodes CBS 100304]
MLPPIPPTVLTSNPQFASLYTTLTQTLLDPNTGCTRAFSRPNDTLDDELRTYRAELAKTQLLQRELSSLTSRANGLSEELQETLDLLMSSYYRGLDDKDKVLLQEEFEELEDNLPMIGKEVSQQLLKTMKEVLMVAYPGETEKYLESKVDALPAEVALRGSSLQKGREELIRRQLALGEVCGEIMETYHGIALRLLSLLKQKSTTTSKALTAKSEHLALVAESMSLKLDVLKNQALSAIYDPEAVDALQNYQMHLRDTSTRLVARQRVVEDGLRKYKSAGSDMRGLVERYSQIMRQMETVAKDIRRLQGA